MDEAEQNLQICVPPRGAKIEKMSPKAEAAFVRRYRRTLIGSTLHLDAILDALWRDGVLTAANLDAINIYAVQGEKQHVLINLLLRKGDKAQEAFYKALHRSSAEGNMEERSRLGKHAGQKQNVAKKILSRIVRALSRSMKRMLLRPVFVPNYFAHFDFASVFAFEPFQSSSCDVVQLQASVWRMKNW